MHFQYKLCVRILQQPSITLPDLNKIWWNDKKLTLLRESLRSTMKYGELGGGIQSQEYKF